MNEKTRPCFPLFGIDFSPAQILLSGFDLSMVGLHRYTHVYNLVGSVSLFMDMIRGFLTSEQIAMMGKLIDLHHNKQSPLIGNKCQRQS